MPYLITMCVVFVLYGIMYNIAKQTGLVPTPTVESEHVFWWIVLVICAVLWPLSITLGLLLGLIWLGSKFTDGIAQAIIKRIKGNKDAS